MRGNTTGNRWAQLLKRHSGRWASSPWISSVLLAAQKRHGVNDGSQAEAAPDLERAATPERTGQEQQQQKTAINAWEGEGGSTPHNENASRR